MIGWRVGWVVGPAPIIGDVRAVSLSNVVCQVGIAQAAALAALASPVEDLAGAVAEWRRRHDLVIAELEGLPVVPAHGGWSVLLDAGELGKTGARLAEDLRHNALVAATPMDGWGSERSARYLRLVFANEPCERLAGLGDKVRRALS